MSPWYYLIVLIEVPALLALAYAGGWWLYLLIAFVALMGMGELYSALITRNIRPEAAVGYLCALLLMAAAQFPPAAMRAELMVLCLFLAVAAPLAAQFTRTGEPDRLRDAALTTLGVVYIALPLCFVFMLCDMDIAKLVTGETAGSLRARIGALLMVAAAVWLSDTAAWWIGKRYGRTKFTPRLSPNKTLEGALAGALTAVLATVIVGAWAGLPVMHGTILGVVLAVAGQIGDLAESVIKRDLKLRDFGTLLGPHGGMLDTFDGMLFAAPVAWFYLWLFLMP
ncbi:MAG: phosphatidate cytidylyltransferase [Armatimonadota bacterium]|nr:phosphatidate cytidylyltransferase [Armatimonadota bacterium]